MQNCADESAALLDGARALAKQLADSEIYREYRTKKTIVGTDDDLNERIRAFKQAHAELELKRLQGQAVAFEEEQHVCHMYSALTLREDSAVFLSLEDTLLSLCWQISEMLYSVIDVDIPL